MWRWAGAVLAVVGLPAVGAWLLTRSAALPASSGVVRLWIPFLEGPRCSRSGTGTSRSPMMACASRTPREIGCGFAGWIRRRPQRSRSRARIRSSRRMESGLACSAINALVKVPVDGGPPATLGAYEQRPAGATWNSAGTIVFATTEGLFEVSDAGGTPRLLAKPDRAQGELLYAWPQFLPGGRSLLFTVRSESGPARVALLNLDTPRADAPARWRRFRQVCVQRSPRLLFGHDVPRGRVRR